MRATRAVSGRFERRQVLKGIGALALATPLLAGAASDETVFYGRWSGTLTATGRTLPVVFEIGLGPSVKLVSVVEGDMKMADAVTIDRERIEARFPSIFGRFEGRLVSQDRIEGKWHQGIYHLPLILSRGTAAAVVAAKQPILTAQRLRQIRTQFHNPALGAAWTTGGAVHMLVDGVRAVKRSVSVKPDDQWHVGSITKSMTATLIATAVDAGELAWDDTVGKLLAPTVPGLSDFARSLTLVQLLSHRAGLGANLPDTQLAGFSPSLDDARDERRRFAALALALPPAGKPAETFLYSNNGYVVAGAMLEARLGRSWETLMRERLFDPLGMRTAGFGAPGHAGQLDQPVGHRAALLPMLFKDARRAVGPGSQKLTDNVAAMGPAGRVHLSMADLIQYLEAHRQRTRLLRPESWSQLHTPPFGGNYALGWEVQPDGTSWHNGSNTLWYAEVSVGAHASACAVSNDGVLSSAVPAVGAALGGAITAAGASAPD